METLFVPSSIPTTTYTQQQSTSRPYKSVTTSIFTPHTKNHLKFPLKSQNRSRYGNSLSIRRGLVRITCGVAEISEVQFSETVLKSDLPVLVEFVAIWCGPCRLMASAIDWVAQEYKDKLTVVKMDHDANPRLIEEYKVYGLPTLILFKNGKEVAGSRREGAIIKTKLKDYVDTMLESISEK